MAIENRDVDQSLQKQEYNYILNTALIGTSSLPTGASLWVAGPIPFYYNLENIRVATHGLSGTMNARLMIMRANGAGGNTIVIVGTTFALLTYGTSGITGQSIFAAGNTLLLGNPGDLVSMDFFGSSVATIQAVMVDVVVKKTQDVVTHYGI